MQHTLPIGNTNVLLVLGSFVPEYFDEELSSLVVAFVALDLNGEVDHLVLDQRPEVDFSSADLSVFIGIVEWDRVVQNVEDQFFLFDEVDELLVVDDIVVLPVLVLRQGSLNRLGVIVEAV